MGGGGGGGSVGGGRGTEPATEPVKVSPLTWRYLGYVNKQQAVTGLLPASPYL